jgi:hypothetical protein
MTDRCDGRYPVPHKREEPFPVTYRCALPMGHDGPHGDGNDRSEPIEQPAQDRLQPMAPGAPDIPALIARLQDFAGCDCGFEHRDPTESAHRGTCRIFDEDAELSLEAADALTTLSASHAEQKALADVYGDAVAEWRPIVERAKELEAELQEAREGALTWQPIATAPKDKMLLLKKGNRIYMGSLGLYGNWNAPGDDEAFTFSGPTHWMLLAALAEQEQR